MKFRPSAVLAIQGRRISAGELIAHLLPHNSFSDIETNMSVLLGNKFSSTLSSKEFSGIAILARGLNPWPALVSDITEMFKLRHIFCHESGYDDRHTIDGPAGQRKATADDNRLVRISEFLVRFAND